VDPARHTLRRRGGEHVNAAFCSSGHSILQSGRRQAFLPFPRSLIFPRPLIDLNPLSH
jgi:hypothetical protein